MANKVLLLSSVGWPSVARLAHGFAAASCIVEALAPQGAVIIQSRYLARWHPYLALFPGRSMRQAIESARPDLLVCCDDRSLACLLSLNEAEGPESEIGRLVTRSLGNAPAIPRLISRKGFLDEARAEGIRIPDTLPIACANDLEHALNTLGLPLVLKSDGSWGGEGVVVARNAAEVRAGFAHLAHPPSRLRSLARALRRRDAHFLLDLLSSSPRTVSAQRFVVGRPAASAFAAWQGEVVGAIYYDALVADAGIGPPNVIRRVECPEIETATRRIAKRFGLSGIHGLDFMRDDEGAAHLIEINPRATQGSMLAFGRGRDLPSELARCLDPNAGARPAIRDDIVVLFPREWHRDPSSPWIALGHHDVPWDDPAVLLATLGVSRQDIARLWPRRRHVPDHIVCHGPQMQANQMVPGE